MNIVKTFYTPHLPSSLLSTNCKPKGKCDAARCEKGFLELWAHKCPKCKQLIHIICCLDWGIEKEDEGNKNLFYPKNYECNYGMNCCLIVFHFS